MLAAGVVVLFVDTGVLLAGEGEEEDEVSSLCLIGRCPQKSQGFPDPLLYSTLKKRY